MTIRLTAGTDDAGRRLDRILRRALPDHSLSLIHRLLRQGKIRVDDAPAGPETRVQPDAVIQIETQREPKPRSEPSRENRAPQASLPDILANGAGIIVFNKPAGLASHGPESLDTLVKAHHARERQSARSLSFRPGPLHRLDRPTSGAIAFSENLAGARLFSELLREGRIAKTYLAIVEGRPAVSRGPAVSREPIVKPKSTGEMIWRDPLRRDGAARKTLVATARDTDGSLAAETRARLLASGDRYSLMELEISTGRTHQIRAQAAAHGYPLAGDLKYGGHPIQGHPKADRDAGGFFLHAWKIEFDRDIDGLPRIVRAPLSRPFLALLRVFFGERLAEKYADRKFGTLP